MKNRILDKYYFILEPYRNNPTSEANEKYVKKYEEYVKYEPAYKLALSLIEILPEDLLFHLYNALGEILKEGRKE